MTQEVIALLMPDTDAGSSDGGQPGVQALVRQPDGGVAIKDVSEETAIRHHAVDRFHRAEPIKDPVTREALASLCQEAAAANRSGLVLINNKAEGSAPLSALRLAQAIAAPAG